MEYIPAKTILSARGILYAMDDIVAAYKTPYETPQLTLFS